MFGKHDLRGFLKVGEDKPDLISVKLFALVLDKPAFITLKLLKGDALGSVSLTCFNPMFDQDSSVESKRITTHFNPILTKFPLWKVLLKKKHKMGERHKLTLLTYQRVSC